MELTKFVIGCIVATGGIGTLALTLLALIESELYE